MTRLSCIIVLSLIFLTASVTLAGGPCVPQSWQQRMAVMTSDGSLVNFAPICRMEVKEVKETKTVSETLTKVVDGKEVKELVTKDVPVVIKVIRCVVQWSEVRPTWQPTRDQSLAFETDGKAIAWEALGERLKKPTLVVVSQTGGMLPDNVAPLFKPGTIVFAPPKPQVEEGDSTPQPLAPAPAVEASGYELPTVSSSPPYAFAVTWQDPDQVRMVGRAENELTNRGVYVISERGHKVSKVAPIRLRFVHMASIDYPAYSVSAITVDGRQLTPEILKRYLQVERTVVVPATNDEVDPFWLQNFRPAVVVMNVPTEQVLPPAPAPSERAPSAPAPALPVAP